jgi:hypothetical protein
MEIKSRLFVDKFYALRSTTSVSKDPFVALGNQKLLYVKEVFSTGVTEWKNLVYGPNESRGGGNGGGYDGVDDRSMAASSYAGSSVATSRATSPVTLPKRQRSPSPSSATPRAQRIVPGPGHSGRLVSPDSSPTSRVPPSQAPWATGYAPRARAVNTVSRGGGGSLLDQMLEAQSVSSRADSPDSDGTVGPGHREIVIPLNPNEGSLGGSPPSSDSDRPSVAVPHSARKHVRRPLEFASADQDDDDVSQYSSVSAATTSSETSTTAPARRSTFQHAISRIPPAPINRLPPAARPARAIPAARGAPIASSSNTTPLGNRVASGSTRPFEVSGGSSTGFGGFKWHQGTQETAPAPKRRDLSVGYISSLSGSISEASYRFEEQLRALDPPPCHRLYITGRCRIRKCKYGHKYILSEEQIGQLMILARRLVSGTSPRKLIG